MSASLPLRERKESTPSHTPCYKLQLSLRLQLPQPCLVCVLYRPSQIRPLLWQFVWRGCRYQFQDRCRAEAFLNRQRIPSTYSHHNVAQYATEFVQYRALLIQHELVRFS